MNCFKNVDVCMWSWNTVEIQQDTYRYEPQNTVRYSQIQSDTVRYGLLAKCICACIQDKHTDTYMHIRIDLNQSICSCMCLYVYDMQANMHLIQLLCERRYMQIHAYTCRYIGVCITYTSCICYMDCVISCAYVVRMQTVCHSHTYTYINPYVCCMCFRYIHICTGSLHRL